MSKWKILTQILKEDGQTTTVHGLPNILRTKNLFLKFMWTISLISSCGACCFLITTSIMSFLDWEVVTKIDFVTEKIGINDILNNSVFDSSSVANQRRIGFSKHLLISEEREKFGMKINESIISCYFNKKKCYLDLDFEYHYDNMHSNCIKFNSGKKTELKKASKPGLINGLQMEIYVDEPSENSLSTASGLYLIVHNNSQESHFPEGFTVPVGKQVNIAVQREFISKKARPYSECTQNLDSVNAFDSDLYRTIIQSGKPYRREMCYDLCLQEIIIEKCKCQDLLSIKFLNFKYCTNVSELECNMKEYGNFYAQNIHESCASKCPLECNTFKYPVNLAYLDYPTDEYSKFLMNDSKIASKFENLTQITYQNLKKNMVFLNIFYDGINLKKIEEVEKFYFIDLVAKIGGTMALFLGISFLSFVELFDIAFKIISIFFKYK
ncbi:Degenerin deg-1 [Brachionus plicatilis]|uniref:Degenerin deg-1 n=1 Tax=Brachionus plicatilis TaxID=10195 RepID=A0A3M7SHJ2_BRAPC|nr:Degenerin deg-1 [Brachionus plicatilis]